MTSQLDGADRVNHGLSARKSIEPLVPPPGARLRILLLAILFGWQVVSLWGIPVYHRFTSQNLPQLALSPGDGYFEIRYEIFTGIWLGVCANLPLLWTLQPARWLRWFGSVAMLLASAMGLLASYGFDDMHFDGLFSIVVGGMVFLFSSLAWRQLLLRRYRLRLEADAPPAAQLEPQRLYLIHFFYFMTTAAVLVSMYLASREYFEWSSVFGYTRQRAATSSLFTLLAATFGIVAHLLMLKSRWVWLMSLVGVALVYAFAGAYYFAVITVFQDPFPFEPYLHVAAAQFALLAGTSLALRLLGYRLVKIG